MRYVLSFGLVLLGTSPVLAAGEQAKAGAPALQGTKQSEVVQVVVPATKQISDADLLQNKGSGPELYYVARSAVIGAALAAGDYIYKQRKQGKKISLTTATAKAAYGAGMGIIDGTLGVASKTIEYGGKVAKYAYYGLKVAFAASSRVIGRLWDKAMRRTTRRK